MSGNTYSYVTLSDTWLTLMNRLNNVVSEVNNKVVKFDTSNSGKKLIMSANVTANGRSFISNANTVQNGTFIAQRNLTANGNALIVNANTVQNGTFIVQRNLTANGNALIVNANTVQNGIAIFQRPVTANGATFSIIANTTITGGLTLKGTTIFQRTLTANGNSLIVNANTVQKGTFIVQRAFTANGVSATFTANVTISGANTNLGTSQLLSSGIVNLNGSNTNVRGGTFYVSSNTMIVSNTHQVTGTHVARKGAPIKHIGLGSNTYTLVLADNGYYLRAANTGGMTLTIPSNGTAAFPVGAEVVVVRTGGNNHLAFANAAGVTMNYADGKKRIATCYSAATLKKVGTNVWDLVGALSA